MTIHAMPLVVGALCVMVIFYRYYHGFIAAKVAVLDDSRKTPAYTMYDGQNYFPTNKWVLSSPSPLHHDRTVLGPVRRAAGYLWILIGVVLAGGARFIIFFASVDTKSRGDSKTKLAPIGDHASIAVLFAWSLRWRASGSR
jgi:carbon starvation protein